MKSLVAYCSGPMTAIGYGLLATESLAEIG